MSIQLGLVIIYILLLFAISFIVKRRASKNPTEYLFAGRKLSATLIAFNVTGLAVGAASTVGVAENATQTGLAAGWYNGAWAIGAVVMGLLAAGKYRSLKCSTIPELFQRSYGRAARLISAVGLALILLCITSLQYVAGGAILSTLLPDIFTLKTGMLMSAAVFIGITMVGGLWSSGLSNILSVCLIYIGVLVSTVIIVMREGGLAAMSAQLPAANFDWFNPFGGLSMAIIIGWIIVMVTQALTAQGTVQIACAAKSSEVARKGFIWAGVGIFPIGFLAAILGMAAKVQYPDINPTVALPQIIMSLDPVLSGVTLAALWAADVSTACTILLATGTLISQDLLMQLFKKQAKLITPQKYLRMNRLVILIVGILTLWLAFNAVGILKSMMIGLSLTTAFTLIFLATVFTPQLCRKGSAFYTTLVGIIGLFLWFFIPEVHFVSHIIYFEWIICLATFFLVRILDPRPITPLHAAAVEDDGIPSEIVTG